MAITVMAASNLGMNRSASIRVTEGISSPNPKPLTMTSDPRRSQVAELRAALVLRDEAQSLRDA